jgi:hypothetical protein
MATNARRDAGRGSKIMKPAAEVYADRFTELKAECDALRLAAAEWEQMANSQSQALTREIARGDALRAERDMWQRTAEEQSWPYEWEVASRLKDERDALREQNAALLAALKAGYDDLYPRNVQLAIATFGLTQDRAAEYVDAALPSLVAMRAAIANAPTDAPKAPGVDLLGALEAMVVQFSEWENHSQYAAIAHARAAIAAHKGKS